MTSYLYFDTETTGLPRHYSDYKMAGQPELVQLAMELYIDEDEKPLFSFAALCSNVDYIPDEALRVHGKTPDLCKSYGISRKSICHQFLRAAGRADFLVCHNAQYDTLIMAKALWDSELEVPDRFYSDKTICTKLEMTPICKLPGRKGYKWPTLQEAHHHCFAEGFSGSHDALADIRATRRVHKWLLKLQRLTTASPKPPALTQPQEG